MRAHARDRCGLGDPPRDLGDLVERDLVERRDGGVGIDLLPEDDGLRRRVAGDGVRVLERQHAAPRGVRARPLDLLLLRPVRAQLVDDLAHAGVRLGALARLEARGELQDRHVGERVVDGVDRVREAALLADLVEQPRAHRTAQQGAVDGQRGTVALVARVDRGTVGDAQVRLVGVALLDQGLRGELGRRLPRAVGLDRREAAERLHQLLVLGHVGEVADEERAAARARPLAPAKAEDRVAAERAQVLLGAQDGAPQRVVAERGAVDQVLGDDRRLVVRAGDLLDHDAALAVELLLVELGAADEVRQQVDRVPDDLGAAGDVERDQVVRRVRVELCAHPLGGLVDLAVVRVLLAALEHEVLEEVGHSVLLGPLGARARLERDEHGHRTGAGEVDPVERQPVGEGGGVDLGHGKQPTDGNDPVQEAGRKGSRGPERIPCMTAHGCHRTPHQTAA